jgi:phosphate transport system substrate-binding protein
MNDDFLHAVRREPPQQFAQRLKRTLQQQAAPRTARFSIMRTVLALFLVGGSVAAAALLIVGDKFLVREGVDVSQVRAADQARSTPQPQATAAEHDNANREITARNRSVRSQRQDDREDAADERRTDADLEGRPAVGRVGFPTTGVPLRDNARASGARHRLRIAASPLAQPLIKAAVDRFIAVNAFPVPQVDTTEASDAFREFCGRAEQQVDVVVTSRRIGGAEFDACRREGAGALFESKIGYQAIVLAGVRGSPVIELSARDVYLALAQWIPDPATPTRLIENPHVKWSQVDARLDARPIEVLGPAADAPARRVFAQLLLEAGCNTQPSIRALRERDPRRYDEVCHTVRRDGVYRELERGALVVPALRKQPNALAILDYRLYATLKAELTDGLLQGAEPTLAALAEGSYPAGRAIYVYSVRDRLERMPGGWQLMSELTGERAIGPSGYLAPRGLVSLDEQERRALRRPTPLQSTFDHTDF